MFVYVLDMNGQPLMPTQSRTLTKGVRDEKKIPTGKIHGFKRYDKVAYLGNTCFVSARRTRGIFVLMDIDGNDLDFRNIGGVKEPSYKSIKRVNARKSVLCVSKRVDY